MQGTPNSTIGIIVAILKTRCELGRARVVYILPRPRSRICKYVRKIQPLRRIFNCSIGNQYTASNTSITSHMHHCCASKMDIVCHITVVLLIFSCLIHRTAVCTIRKCVFDESPIYLNGSSNLFPLLRLSNHYLKITTCHFHNQRCIAFISSTLLRLTYISVICGHGD